jgi:pheromone shutdown protein TraB
MNNRLITLSLIIFAIAIFRILPHPPNVSPVAAMALFGGAYISDKRVAFLLPFLALLLSDLLLGLHDTMLYVYGGFALTVVIGFWLRNNSTTGRIALAATGASVAFFVITNFGVWLTSGLYPMTSDGLMQAYVAAIPFFQNSLLGNLCFTALMFGGFALLQRNVPTLSENT